MPEKRDPFKSSTEKAIRLFSRLFFMRRAYSLSELAQWLNASKQTVIRLMGEIERSYGIQLETFVRDRQRYYRIKSVASNTHVPISCEELNLLELCRTFTAHLIGEQLLRDVERTIEKACALLPPGEEMPPSVFDTAMFGTIDYTPFSEFLKTLTSAIETQRICDITYKSLGMPKPTTFSFKALRIISRRDTIYVYGLKCSDADEAPRLLALHRIQAITLTEQRFEAISGNISKELSDTFGIRQEDLFKVTVEFTGMPAHYVAERRWSLDQRIQWLEEDKMRITFTASSRPEVISWILAFGDLGYILEPKELAEEVSEILKKALANYAVLID